MSRIAMYYFSGTGNTARAVGRMAEIFRQAGHTVTVLEIVAGLQPQGHSADLHLFAYPTLSFSAPEMVKKFWRRLPNGGGARAAVLACIGGTVHRNKMDFGNPGQGLVQAERILRRRGYRVFLTRAVTFPANWTQAFNPPDDKAAQTIITRGDDLVDAFAIDFLDGKEDRHRVGPLARVFMGLMALVFGALGRRMLGKMYVADVGCSGCGLCVKTCPAKAVIMRGGRPRWLFTCQVCCRCINICPEKSIQFSVPLLVIHFAFHVSTVIWLVSVLFNVVLPLLPPAGVLQTAAGVLLFVSALILVTVMQVALVDPLLFLLSGIKSMRRFFSLSWTQRFRRYSAPGFKPQRTGVNPKSN